MSKTTKLILHDGYVYTVLNSSESYDFQTCQIYPQSHPFQVFSPFANHYGLNEELLKCEFTVFSNQYWKKNPQLNTMLDVINFIEPHKVVYIELYKAYLPALSQLLPPRQNVLFHA